MKYFDVFAGVGGFSLGIHNAYVDNRHQVGQKTAFLSKHLPDNSSDKLQGTATCIGFSEYDKFASDVLRYHYPNIKNYGDITKINWDTVPDFDLLVGGSPCQSFSIAGKRAGFNGASGLFWEYLRALKEKKPDYFIWENVKGVLSSNHGFDFANIINSFSEAGYALWWQVLNSTAFGVPQNRERIFVFGSRNGCPREVFFKREDDSVGNVLDGREAQIAGTLNCCMAKGGNKQDAKSGLFIKQLNNPTHSNNRVYADDGLSPALNTMQGGNRQPKVCLPVLTPDRMEKRQNGRRFKEDGDPSFTLTSQDRHGIYDGYRIRRLMPIECERLMSWPDNHTKYGRKEDGTVYEMSDSQRYKQCGNGVVSKVVEHLIREHFNP